MTEHLPERARVQARFARVALTLYVGMALVAAVLLAAILADDRSNQEQITLETLKLSNAVRADYLARHLDLLAQELRRLGLRSEVDLFDENLEPEQRLLRLAHAKSTFFNVGVAILDTRGAVASSEPDTFLARGRSLGEEPWFDELRQDPSPRIVAVPGGGASDMLVYVISPVVRNDRFAGAVLGALRLSFGEPGAPGTAEVLPDDARADVVLTVNDGRRVYPSSAPPLLESPTWSRLFPRVDADPFVTSAVFQGVTMLIAGAPVHGTDLLLFALVPERELFATARVRFFEQIGATLSLGLLPSLFLLFQFRRALRVFRRSEEKALRDERLRFLGEAANLIAHEVKNALNTLRLGIDMLVGPEKQETSGTKLRAVTGLRTEIERLSDFTTELLLFSRGISPKPVSLNLGEFVRRVAGLQLEAAAKAGVELSVETGGEVVRVKADPQLIHVVVTNLVLNAIEAVTSREIESPHIDVRVSSRKGTAEMTVRDNGPGVPPDVRSRLFEPFVTGKPNGTGIGLALSRKIAVAHLGDLTLAEEPVGARFVLTLPMEGT